MKLPKSILKGGGTMMRWLALSLGFLNSNAPAKWGCVEDHRFYDYSISCHWKCVRCRSFVKLKGIFINQDFMPRALKVISMQFDFSRRTQSCSSLSLNILVLLCDLNNLWQTQLQSCASGSRLYFPSLFRLRLLFTLQVNVLQHPAVKKMWLDSYIYH